MKKRINYMETLEDASEEEEYDMYLYDCGFKNWPKGGQNQRPHHADKRRHLQNKGAMDSLFGSTENDAGREAPGMDPREKPGH